MAAKGGQRVLSGHGGTMTNQELPSTGSDSLDQSLPSPVSAQERLLPKARKGEGMAGCVVSFALFAMARVNAPVSRWTLAQHPRWRNPLTCCRHAHSKQWAWHPT